MRKKHFLLIILLFSMQLANAQLISNTGSLNVPRLDHSSQLLNNGKVLAFGGDNGDFQNFQAFKSAELFNPTTGSWSLTGNLNHERTITTSIVLDNGNVLAVGGVDNDFMELKSCEIYDVAAGTWSYTDSMTYPRKDARLVKLNNGKILAVGGYFNSSCELYDQTTNTWTVTASMNIYRWIGADIVKLADGNILLVGGGMDTAEIYDATAGTWAKISNTMKTEREGADAIMMTNGKVLISGDGKTTEIFDPATSTFTLTGGLLNGRMDCEMINLDNGMVLIFGPGEFSFTDTKALEVYSPDHGTWSSAGTVSPQYFGPIGYTVHKLTSGKILYIGGDLGGSSQYCYLVNQSSVAFTGVQEEISVDGLTLAVYPNPVMELLKVEGGINVSNGELMILNICGQVIHSRKLGTGLLRETIDMRGFEKGIYQLNVISGGNIYNRQIVVQ